MGNSLVTSEFPSQRASNAETISIWWCSHAKPKRFEKWGSLILFLLMPRHFVAQGCYYQMWHWTFFNRKDIDGIVWSDQIIVEQNLIGSRNYWKKIRLKILNFIISLNLCFSCFPQPIVKIHTAFWAETDNLLYKVLQQKPTMECI